MIKVDGTFYSKIINSMHGLSPRSLVDLLNHHPAAFDKSKQCVIISDDEGKQLVKFFVKSGYVISFNNSKMTIHTNRGMTQEFDLGVLCTEIDEEHAGRALMNALDPIEPVALSSQSIAGMLAHKRLTDLMAQTHVVHTDVATEVSSSVNAAVRAAWIKK